jgi:hypothetical protein
MLFNHNKTKYIHITTVMGISGYEKEREDVERGCDCTDKGFEFGVFEWHADGSSSVAQ